MVYRAYCHDTGEIWESDCFRNVYRCSMFSVKGYVHDARKVSVIEITKCAAIAEWRDSRGYYHSEPIDEELVCMIAVSAGGYTIDYGSTIFEVNKDAWTVEVCTK